MMIYATAAVVFLVVTFLSAHERIQPIAKEKTNVSRDLGDIVQNTPWIALFIVTILFILFVCIRMNVTTHYFKYYIGEQSVTLFGTTHKYGFEVLASAFNTVGQLLSLLGMALIPLFARRLGRKKAAIILFVTALVCTGSFYFFKPENLALIFVFQAIGSMAGGPISALLWIMYADTADYSEWKTGRRATGLVFSASIMSNKLGWAIGSMVAAFILDKTGFVANVAQNINVLNGLKEMMSVIPVVVGALALIILVFFYKLDEATMAKVKAALDERRKAGAQAAPTV
jgi:GPH family glycoside/pentoside/hexuronide:cation symporter